MNLSKSDANASEAANNADDAIPLENNRTFKLCELIFILSSNTMKLPFLSSIGVLALFCAVDANAFSSQAAAPASSSTTTTTAPTLTFSSLPSLSAFDYNQNSRLPYFEKGYASWKWRNHDINYLELGDSSKPPLLFIHGFGASSYHFRYNIPDLAKDYHVYAFDLLGFGFSSKPIQEDYDAAIWRDQTLDFIEQVIGRPCAVAGNSLGGFTALYAASSERGHDWITACISLNGAGRFRDPSSSVKTETNVFMKSIMTALQRFVIQASFLYTKQPARIEQVLKQVYPVNADNVDEELVKSIQTPSFHPNAAEVFYRVITKNGSGPASVTVDECLETLKCPLLLCWGEEDPWIRSAAADKMQALYPSAKRVSINAGHCPHDEAPHAVNTAIREFVNSVNENNNNQK